MSIEILSDLVITKIRSVSTLYNSKNNGVKRFDRPCWAVVVKYEGETVYTCQKKKFISDLSHIVVLPKGCSYEWRCTESGHFCALEFESDATYHQPIVCTVKNGEKILKMLKDMEYKHNIKNQIPRIEGIRDTYSILLALTHSSEKQYLSTDKQKKIAPALKYISKHYNEKITNEMLASISGISAVYFRKLFAGIMGISPIAYVHELRIEKAKEMLKSDYGSISDIAESLGYLNLYDFSRDFKKHTGVAPSNF